jgi:hypothetical protein
MSDCLSRSNALKLSCERRYGNVLGHPQHTCTHIFSSAGAARQLQRHVIRRVRLSAPASQQFPERAWTKNLKWGIICNDE